MIQRILLLCCLILSLAAAPAAAHTLRLADRAYVSFDQLLDDLSRSRIVLIGELHDRLDHHQAQLQIIDGLHRRGIPLAIGLEMFRASDQAILDRWVAGGLDEKAFRPHFERNWGMWPVYREIFLYAQKERIPLVGLNLPREISQKVAREGFASLEPHQLQQLPRVRCDVSPAYQQFIRQALGLHGGEGRAFLNFCEAQVLWDSYMALTAEAWLQERPERTMVILTGAGHAWRMGIPTQLERFGQEETKVVLPAMPGRLQPAQASLEEADYLLLGTEEGPLH